ncbi:MAG: OmpA family protein [Cyclobacteriaceae bacterium]|nr:OmpA family protein [Cyclobacteriaceae bacterium]
MYSRAIVFFSITAFLLGGCVSQQKYNALLNARDNLELKATEYSVQLAQERTKAMSLQGKNQDLNRQLMQSNVDNQRVTRELDKLQKDETSLASEYQSLTLKYEDMRDYFDIVLNECDQDKIGVARRQRQLDQRADSIENAIVRLGGMESDLIERERTVKVWELKADNQSSLIEAVYQDVNQSLSSLVSEQFNINKTGDGVLIAIDEPILFEPGSVTITDYGAQALEQLAIALNAQENIQVRVVGHTDRNRIAKKAKYLTDNWDLSVLKAAAVARELTESKLDPRILTVAGRGEIDPMVSNETPEGRDKNKRTEIVVTPQQPGQANLHNSQNTN